MTASPLLPPGAARHMAEAEATDAELRRMTELALSRGARAIASRAAGGHGGRTDHRMAASRLRSACLAAGPPT